MVAATNSLLSDLRVVRPHLSRGHRFPSLCFVVLFLPISILGIALFLHNSQDHQPHQSPNSNPDLDVYKIPIRNKLNKTQMASVKRYINNQTEVAFTLMKQLFSTEAKGKNMVFSPLSIHTVLSLIAAGSKGSTREQLLAFLKSKSTQELSDLASTLAPLLFAKGSPNGAGTNLTFANGVWIDHSLAIKPSFKQVVEMAYKASLKQVDFKSKPDEVRIEVNSWAEKQTNGLIKDILPPHIVDSLTRLILANALYFKGAWENRFDASKTVEENFNLFDGSLVKTSFMTSWVTNWGRLYIGVFEGFKVLKLPYERDRDLERSFSMYVFLPNERDGLPALAERLASESGFFDRHLPRDTVEVGKFRLPKFKFTSSFEVSEALKALGLVLPSSPGDFTEMVDSDSPISGSKILHKSFIDVTGEGTEAAAVTVGLLVFGATLRFEEIEKVDFVADHPFLFIIREETMKSMLFIGQVFNPTAH